MKFQLGEKIIIIRGDHARKVGIILSSRIIYGTMYVYDIDMMNGICVTDIYEGDLLSLNTKEKDNNTTEVHFDIDKYLSDEQKSTIARDMFKRKLSQRIDNIIEARCAGNIVDMIIAEIAQQYVKKFGSEYDDKIKQMITDIMNSKESTSSDYDDTFFNNLRYKLTGLMDKYISEHNNTIYEWVTPGLRKFVEDFSSNKVPGHISNKISSIISAAVHEVTKEIYDKGIVE